MKRPLLLLLLQHERACVYGMWMHARRSSDAQVYADQGLQCLAFGASSTPRSTLSIRRLREVTRAVSKHPVRSMMSVNASHLHRCDSLRRQGVLCRAKAELPILVPAECVQLATVKHYQRMRVTTGDLPDQLPREECYPLRHEDVVAAAMT
jgi:hypothetical protein